MQGFQHTHKLWTLFSLGPTVCAHTRPSLVQLISPISTHAKIRQIKKKEKRRTDFLKFGKISKASRNRGSIRTKQKEIDPNLNFENEFKIIKHQFTRRGDVDVLKYVTLMNNLTDLAKAWELFEYSLKVGAIDQKYGGNIFSKFIEVCVANNDWKKCLEAREKLENTKKLPTATDFCEIIKCLASNDQVEESIRISEQNKSLFPKNSHHEEISAALQIMYNRIDEPAQKLALLETMNSLGVKVDTINYTSMISKMMKQGDLKKAMDLFTQMKEKGFRPNEVTFSAIIDGFFKSGKVEQALETFTSMSKLNIKQGVSIYNTVASGLMRAGKTEEGWEILGVMEKQKIKPDIITYNLMLNELVRQGFLDKAIEMMTRMTKENVKPDAITYTTLIGGYGKRGEIEKALEFYKEMKAQKITPDTVTYCTLIITLSKADMPEKTHEIYQTMRFENLVPTTNAFTSLISVMTKHNQLEISLKIFEDMKKVGLTPDRFVYTALISAFGKARKPHEAFQIYLHMLDNNVKPDRVLYVSLIDSLAKNSEFKLAAQVSEKMEASGLGAYGEERNNPNKHGKFQIQYAKRRDGDEERGTEGEGKQIEQGNKVGEVKREGNQKISQNVADKKGVEGEVKKEDMGEAGATTTSPPPSILGKSFVTSQISPSLKKKKTRMKDIELEFKKDEDRKKKDKEIREKISFFS